WLYQSVLGIRPDPSGPGFKKFILAPQPDPTTGLTWARGSYDSAHGRIVSDWTSENGRFTLQAVIPPNTIVTLFVPAKDADSVTESGKPAAQAESGAAVLAVGSGTYQFQSTIPEITK
ncbi:MAG: alpha-L-rhamnosidase, partial [Verrucomicrobia bacterium]|nr:alpha-L-rhamnosidase [Verrucomicrobiota bacterium]